MKKFSNEEIAKMREMIEDKELVEDDKLEDLSKLRNDIFVNSLFLGKLYLFCYDSFTMNLHLFKQYKQKLENFIKFEDSGRLRDFFEIYGDGDGFGSNYTLHKIRKLVDKNRIKMLNVVDLFFRIVGEEI